ncbi:hypothetical protein ASD94_22805 [Acidovorax sp. Root70]|nr:hypothetical protein ASD94_22805 [Acidovorax sp. Root70]
MQQPVLAQVFAPGAPGLTHQAALAEQVGVDIPLAKNLYLNFDVKKVFIKTDVFVHRAKDPAQQVELPVESA